MKVLVTGACGFVGAALVRHLADLGYEVRAAMRRPRPVPAGVSRFAGLALDAEADWTDALAGVDAVIHCAARVHVMGECGDAAQAFQAVNVHGTRRLAEQAVTAGCRRFIFLSSVKVNGERTLPGAPFTEADPPAPVDPYGQSKFDAERALFELGSASGLEVVVIRPPLVYGPGVKANFAAMVHWLRKERPLPLGRIDNLRSFVALGNLVDLTETCLRHPSAAGETFLVSDDDDVSTPRLLARISRALGVKTKLLPVPVPLLRVFAIMFRKQAAVDRLCSNLQVDISKARNRLGWAPPVTMLEELTLLAASTQTQVSK